MLTEEEQREFRRRQLVELQNAYPQYTDVDLEKDLAAYDREREEQANHESAVAVVIMFVALVAAAIICGVMHVTQTLEQHEQRIDRLESPHGLISPYC